jgi:hypothetical protein
MSAAAKPATPDEPAGDVKSKFRDALERKRDKQQGRAADAQDGESSKVHGEHGPAHVQRTFRRKSGG